MQGRHVESSVAIQVTDLHREDRRAALEDLRFLSHRAVASAEVDGNFTPAIVGYRGDVQVAVSVQVTDRQRGRTNPG
ncbi:MAG TPA: hypothetical protein VMQ62_02755, partial [Dongiaceae bacterium]|nr:hypothetical protein [Dongiaceae bacterium]